MTKKKFNEFLKLLNDLKAIKIGTEGDTTKLKDMYKQLIPDILQ